MYKQLTREQRYTIDILLKQKQRKKDIAQAIGVHPSTITREIKVNGEDIAMKLRTNYPKIEKFRLPGNRAISESIKKQGNLFFEIRTMVA